MKKVEERLQTVISNYIKLQYPYVIFTAEKSGLKLSIGQAVKAKNQRNPSRGLPDVLILQPNKHYKGLFLEVKKETPYLKSGKLSNNKHIQEQNEVLKRLNSLGYLALFVWSYEMAKVILDSYMKEI